MLNYRKINLGGGPQSLVHDLITQDGLTVIGDSDGSCALQSTKVGKHSAFAGTGRGRHRKNVDHRAALPLLHPFDPFRRIQNWVRVWHAADRSESASRGSCSPGGDTLFVNLAGLAQVNMQINKAGSNDQAASIKFVVSAATNFIGQSDFSDASISQQNIH